MGCGAEAQPTPHCGVIYSYIHILGNLFISFLIYSKERRIAVFPKTESLSLVVLKRAPHYHVLENGVFLIFSTQKSAAGPYSRKWGTFKVCILKIVPHGVFLKLEYFLCVFKRAPHCPSLENRLGFWLRIYFTFRMDVLGI